MGVLVPPWCLGLWMTVTFLFSSAMKITVSSSSVSEFSLLAVLRFELIERLNGPKFWLPCSFPRRERKYCFQALVRFILLFRFYSIKEPTDEKGCFTIACHLNLFTTAKYSHLDNPVSYSVVTSPSQITILSPMIQDSFTPILPPSISLPIIFLCLYFKHHRWS